MRRRSRFGGDSRRLVRGKGSAWFACCSCVVRIGSLYCIFCACSCALCFVVDVSLGSGEEQQQQEAAIPALVLQQPGRKMWLCVQGLKLGASSVGTNFSHSVRSHHCLSQALSSSPQQAGGISGRRHRDLRVAIAGGGGGGGHDGRLKVAGLPPACILRVDMASQRRYCNMGNRRVLARCAGDSGRGGNEAQSPPQEAVLKAITGFFFGHLYFSRLPPWLRSYPESADFSVFVSRICSSNPVVAIRDGKRLG